MSGFSFGNTQNNAGASTTGGLFALGANQASQSTTQNTTGGGLFGGSLFGNNNNNNQQQQNNTSTTGTSLFGGMNNSMAQNNPNQAQPQQTQQPQQPQQTQQNNHISNAQFQLQTGLGSVSGTALTAAQQQELARSRLQQSGLDSRTNSKPVFDSAKTLIQKWDPNSQDTTLQAYLYNAVNSAYAPFYHRNADEDEKSWDAALAEKPPNTEIDGQQISYVPVLVRGFKALGERVEYQANIVNEMRRRLHEMNNSLSAVMAAHEQKISVKVEAARRQHIALSQRTLRLAVKVQVLRNRGYALDSTEENLRQMLLDLQKKVMDPTINGREEEIWARMVALRERSRWLEEEGKRIGQQVQEQQHAKVPDEVLVKTKKILQDYQNQLGHLSLEMEEVKKEFAQWEEMQQAKSQARR